MIKIGIGGPGVTCHVGPTGTVYFVESDLADLVGLSPGDFAMLARRFGADVVEVDGQRFAVRTAAWLLDLAMHDQSRVPRPLQPLWVASRKLLRELGDTGLRSWIDHARDRQARPQK